MPCVRFDDIWSCLRWCDQPKRRPAGMSSRRFRWRLADDFANRFDDHREAMVTHSEVICIDESKSRWYSMGGYWINMGITMYIAINRKPENGCKIQNSASRKSSIMLQLKLVKELEAEGIIVEEGVYYMELLF